MLLKKNTPLSSQFHRLHVGINFGQRPYNLKNSVINYFICWHNSVVKEIATWPCLLAKPEKNCLKEQNQNWECFMPLPHFLQKAGKWTLVIGNRLANMQLILSIFHVFDVQFKHNFFPFLKGPVEQCVYAHIPKPSELFPNNPWHRRGSTSKKISVNKLPTPTKKVRVQLTPAQNSHKLRLSWCPHVVHWLPSSAGS